VKAGNIQGGLRLFYPGQQGRAPPHARNRVRELSGAGDAPELPDWSGAKRGVFYRPVKQQLTLRLDADLVAWFETHTRSDEGHQTRIDRALREYVHGHAKAKRRPKSA